MNSLDGRVIAVAGVGGGLGPLVARALADAGATVAGTDRSAEALEAIGEELGIGERWDGRTADLLDEAAVAAWRDGIVERYGRVDGLAHLVGGWRGGEPLHKEPLADWELLHDLLIRTVQLTTRAFHDQIEAAGSRGRFVLVSAKQAQAPSNSNAGYAAAKAAAEAWTLAYADGFEAGGATANIVVVDAILTPKMREEDPGGDFAGMTRAEDLAEAIVFLCSDAAAAMNGQRLPLNIR